VDEEATGEGGVGNTGRAGGRRRDGGGWEDRERKGGIEKRSGWSSCKPFKGSGTETGTGDMTNRGEEREEKRMVSSAVVGCRVRHASCGRI
jgi:hypothetical protein